MLTTGHLVVKSNDDMSGEHVAKITALLIEGFREKSSLFAISKHVTERMEDKQAGKWLCLITPNEVELGLTFVSNNYLKFEFENEAILYRITVCETRI